jgi:hypothetical protein
MTTARVAKRERQRAARKRRKEARTPAPAPGKPDALSNAEDLPPSKRLDLSEIAYAHHLYSKLRKAGHQCGVRNGYVYLELGGGECGWIQARQDDCLRMAVATLLQIPPYEVPDLEVDKQLERGHSPDLIAAAVVETYSVWAANRGLRMTVHDRLPVDRDRWLGVVIQPGYFQNHCLIMQRRKVRFEPVPPLAPRGLRLKRFQIGDVQYGVTFDAIEKGNE